MLCLRASFLTYTIAVRSPPPLPPSSVMDYPLYTNGGDPSVPWDSYGMLYDIFSLAAYVCTCTWLDSPDPPPSRRLNQYSHDISLLDSPALRIPPRRHTYSFLAFYGLGKGGRGGHPTYGCCMYAFRDSSAQLSWILAITEIDFSFSRELGLSYMYVASPGTVQCGMVLVRPGEGEGEGVDYHIHTYTHTHARTHTYTTTFKSTHSPLDLQHQLKPQSHSQGYYFPVLHPVLQSGTYRYRYQYRVEKIKRKAETCTCVKQRFDPSSPPKIDRLIHMY